jgi:hypothetical protein
MVPQNLSASELIPSRPSGDSSQLLQPRPKVYRSRRLFLGNKNPEVIE